MFVRLLILLVASALFGCSSAPTVGDETDELVGKPGAPEVAEFNRGTLWYGISIQDDHLDIAVRLIGPPDGQTSFFLPGPWAGRADHADRLSIGEARTQDGPAFLTIDRTAGRIDIETRDAEWVELAYSVNLQTSVESRFAPRFRDGVAVLFGPTFLVLPSQQVLDRTRDIPIEVHAPDPWNVMTTWASVAEKASSVTASVRVHGFVASDGEMLRDAFLVAGDELNMKAPKATPETTVAFSPHFRGDDAAVTELIGTVVSGYRGLFGTLGPTRVFVDTPSESDESYGGVGRRGGFVLQLPERAGRSDEVALLVAHEALHLWNGHHLVPHSSDEAVTRWFKEGVTHYIALKSALRWGLIEFDFAAEELARVASSYYRNPLAHGQRGRDLDRARFPYDQGALLALEVDASLARASEGDIGVEEWLRALDERTGSGGRYNRTNLTQALRDISTPIGAEAPAIMRRHLDGPRPIDLRALFHRADLHWLPSERSRAARVIALERQSPLYAILFGPTDEP